jgi:hypothetical protein
MAFISNGTTILDNGAFSVGLGGLVLLSEQTASSSASISFTSGIDSTYPIYKFEFINIHPQTNGFLTEFNLSTDGGSNYNVVKTSTAFRPFHYESDVTDFGYNTYNDLAQSTAYQPLCENQGNNNDDSMSGHLILFNPSSSTYVKHWISNVNMSHNASYPASVNWFTAGYGNTTSPINAIIFRISSGNMDSGTIKLYGIKDS